MIFSIKKGIEIPIAGAPEQHIRNGQPISQIALVGDDYIALKPTMLVQVGEPVALGQPLFEDKKNSGVKFCSPASGTVAAINRGPKRKFESIIIAIEGNRRINFPSLNQRQPSDLSADEIRQTLIDSGLWTSFRTRPFGKIPQINNSPASIFITAIDTEPLAANPEVIISHYQEDFQLGVRLIKRLVQKIFLCTKKGPHIANHTYQGVTNCEFSGPHPAGLPSTHIHLIDPVHTNKSVWHINYHDIIAIGHLFRRGYLLDERVVSLAGPGVTTPSLIKTIIGANLKELCSQQIASQNLRVISGSVLSGRQAKEPTDFLGRYHQQITVIEEGDGRGLLKWLAAGKDRFSSLPLFLSAVSKKNNFAFNTATWGGRRAIFPLGTYEKVMPLDIIATSLLQSLAVGNTEKAQELGCLELVEEDLALCSFVCPGKNNFGPMLRYILTQIEAEG